MALLTMAQGAWSQGKDEWLVRTDHDGWYMLGGAKLNGQPTQEGVYINKAKKRLKH